MCVMTVTRRHLWRGVLVRDACKYHVVNETAEEQEETCGDEHEWPESFHGVCCRLTDLCKPMLEKLCEHGGVVGQRGWSEQEETPEVRG